MSTISEDQGRRAVRRGGAAAAASAASAAGGAGGGPSSPSRDVPTSDGPQLPTSDPRVMALVKEIIAICGVKIDIDTHKELIGFATELLNSATKDGKTVSKKQKKEIKICQETNTESTHVHSRRIPNEKDITCNASDTDINSVIKKVSEYISSNGDSKIFLLKNQEVIQWLFGDLTFLPPIDKKNKTSDEVKYKVLEDKWGQDILKIRRPDLKLDKQWTNKFGEHICEEIYTLLGKNYSKPLKKKRYQPDLEVNDAIVEVKTGTFHTSGTAGEKILGCPFKYAEIPELYGKPLKILCMGGAEKVCRESYGNLPGAMCSAQKKKFLDFFRDNGIEYVGASDILRSLSFTAC